MAVPPTPPSRLLTWLKRLLSGPSHRIMLSNRSQARWAFELVAAVPFREQTGRLRFQRLEGPGRPVRAGLSKPGDTVFLEAGASYRLEVFEDGGRFLRFFRLVDGSGNGHGSRFLMDLDGESKAVVVRLFDGVDGPPERRPLRHPTPGILEIALNAWPTGANE